MIRSILVLLAALTFSAVHAGDLTVPMTKVDEKGIGEAIGDVTLVQTAKGVQFKPDLHGLPPGEHGFHVHEQPDCRPGEKDGKTGAALAAGGHYDPSKTGKHLGPKGKGHLGDLPKLVVGDDGRATQAVIAPRIKLKDVANRALMIHAGGDNFADQPQALGGGGARIACGVIPARTKTGS